MNRKFATLALLSASLVSVFGGAATSTATPLPYQYYQSADKITIEPTELVTNEGGESEFRIGVDNVISSPRWLKQIFVRPDSSSDVGKGFGVMRSFSLGSDGYSLVLQDDDNGTSTRVNGNGTVLIKVRSLDDKTVQGTHKSSIQINETDYLASDTYNSPPSWTQEIPVVTVTNTITDNDKSSPRASKTIPTETVVELDYSLEAYDAFNHGEAQPLDLRNGQMVGFSVGNSAGKESHTAKVTDLTNETVTLLIASEPFEVTLKIGQTGEYDVTDDPINDIQVVVLGFHNGAANIAFKAIHSPAGSNPAATSEKHFIKKADAIPKNESNLRWFIVAGISLVTILGVAAWSTRGRIASFWRKLATRFARNSGK